MPIVFNRMKDLSLMLASATSPSNQFTALQWARIMEKLPIGDIVTYQTFVDATITAGYGDYPVVYLANTLKALGATNEIDGEQQ